MYNLYPFQQKEFDGIVKDLTKYNKIIEVLPTGAGKTVLASKLLCNYVNALNKRAFFIVNRQELVTQSFEKFNKSGLDMSIIKAGFDKYFNPYKRLQLAMIQTFDARKDKLPDLAPDYIFWDEIHDGYTGQRYDNLIKRYPRAKLVGLTATPIDMGGYLLPGFQKYRQELQIRDLQNLGILSDDRVFVPCKPDLTGVKVTAGDYNEYELGEACSEATLLTNIVENFTKHARGLKTVVFAVNIAHAEKLCEEFKKAGYNRTAVIHSQMDGNRQQVLNDFKTGKLQILVNCSILTTGWDEPSVECLILARPTKSRRLAVQIFGRGLRRIKGIKDTCLFLDCASVCEMHGLPSDDRYYEPKPEKKSRKQDEEDNKPRIKLCPECGCANPPSVRFCINCKTIFPNVLKPEVHADLIEINKQQYSEDETLEMLKDYIREKTDKKEGWAVYLLRDIKAIKPEEMKERAFFKKVQGFINKASKKGYNPYWIVYRLKDSLTGSIEGDSGKTA